MRARRRSDDAVCRRASDRPYDVQVAGELSIFSQYFSSARRLSLEAPTANSSALLVPAMQTAALRRRGAVCFDDATGQDPVRDDERQRSDRTTAERITTRSPKRTSNAPEPVGRCLASVVHRHRQAWTGGGRRPLAPALKSTGGDALEGVADPRPVPVGRGGDSSALQ